MAANKTSPRFWKDLLRAIRHKRVIPILGWEMMLMRDGERDVLLARYLAERLAKEMDVSSDDLQDGQELNTIACRYLEEDGDPEEVHSILYDVFPKEDELRIPDPLLKLAEITPLRLFVTTTFDPYLERALNEKRFDKRKNTQVISYSPKRVKDLPADEDTAGRVTVYHLLGKLSPAKDYAVTDEDTLEFMHALQAQERRPPLLFDKLADNQLLFIGSGFPNWLQRFFVRTTAGVPLSDAKGKNFVADVSVREDLALREFLASFSAKTLIYNDGDPVEFIDELHRRWMEEHGSEESVAPEEPASSPGPSFMPGSVFISYASEDVAAATALRDKFEAAKLDVWFDKERLEAGDKYGKKILESIEDCSVFVPVISKHTITPERRWFRKEWGAAEEQASMASETSRFILPVVIDDTPKDHREIPTVFRECQLSDAPNGECSPEFVKTVREVFRNYHLVKQG